MRSRLAAIAARRPLPMLLQLGESNAGGGARNDLTALPSGYLAASYPGAWLWDDTTSNKFVTLVPGPQEQQPGGAAYVDPAYTNTVGPGGEIARLRQAFRPGEQFGMFNQQQGGGRFSDAASRGRAANWLPNLSDGAYAENLVSWRDAKAGAAARGWDLRPSATLITLGGNTASSGTETAAFESDLTNYIAALRRDIIGDSLVVLARLGNQQTDTNSTNRATIRTAQQNIAAADPSRVQIMDMDAMSVVGGAIDNIHFSSPAEMLIGEAFVHHECGLWYPAKYIQEVGDPQYPLRQWRFGGADATIASNFIASVPSTVDGGQNLTIGAGNRPALATTTIKNGLTMRSGAWDGIDDYLLGASGALINNSGGFILWGAIKAPATNNVAVICEGHDSQTNQFWALKSNSSGNPCITIRNDAGTLLLSLVSLGGVLFDNTRHAFALVWDSSTFTIYIDGVAGGSPQTITKGTMTLQNLTVGAQKVGGGVSAFFAIDCPALNVAQYSATNLAAFIAYTVGYCQRMYGTP